MIELYAKGTTDFSKNGIRIWPQDSTVTYQENGQWVIDFTVPAGSGYTDFDYGQLIKATVPTQHMDEISLGEVSYYIVSNANGANLYSERPGTQKVSYKNWEDQRSYSQNNYVTYNGENWRCKESHGGISNPPEEGDLWAKASKQINTPGKIAKQMAQGDVIFITSEFNATWYEAAALDGTTGYIRKADVEATGESEERTIPARDITEQIFVITEIDKSREKQEIRIGGEHISYNMKRTTIGGCIVKNVTPATALLFIKGAMREEYGGELYTTLDEPMIDADWSWKNVQSALLDPKNGLVKLTDGQLIRDNMDIFLISGEEQEPKYSVRYGANMKTVNWHGNVTDIVTRVRPLAQTEDGRTLLLPEEYIDTVRNIPFIQPETLNTGLKIGQKEEDSTGAEVELTEEMVIERMRTMASNRFTVDKCDVPEISLDLDWLHMPDTEEYAQYHALENAAPGDWVDVVDGPMGISAVIRMTGYTWDTEKGRYKGAKFGKVNERPTIAGYSIKSGAVGGSAIAHGAVTGAHLMASSITAREIEANSITAQQIASRSIITENLMANCITANEIMAQAITTEKLAAHAITADKIDALDIRTAILDAGKITADDIETGSLTAEVIAAGAITTEKLAAEAITAGKIAAGAITTEKLAAEAVTAGKIAARSITADKIDVNAVTAEKISTTDLDAINAKLGTATIAQAEIATADINFAHIKDLNAESAYFGQAVFDEAVGGKLYVPRLAVGYAQMIGATIGDLVIQASNGNFYGIDVDLNGEVVATQRTVTSEEISAGHTLDGKSLVLGTDILATDLNTENIYASHALMNEITAAIINVDQLWARDAFIGKLMTTNLMSNTYIQATVGNWTSGSTITQTINSLDARISELGYGTIFMQDSEPDHSDLVAGDVWIRTLPTTSWNDIDSDYSSWQDVYNNVSSWQVLAAMPIMYVWDGQHWQEMYDSLLPENTQTQIQQLSTEITLRATTEQVDALGNTVNEFAAELTVQSLEIQAAVSAVDAKASSYVMWADPRTAYVVSLGDIWIKQDKNLDTWQDLYDEYSTWQQVYDIYNTNWKDLLGATTYVWDGTEWVESSDVASEILNETRVIENERSITLLASQQAVLQGDLYTANAQITVIASEIRQEVSRATAAEGGKLDKTTNYQTADAIVSEAVRQAAASAGSAYIAKTSTLQTPDQIVSEALRQAASAADGEYIAKTTNLQTADAIELAAEKKSAANIVPDFSESTSYAVGNYVSRNGEVYRFRVAHPAGAWNATHVEKKKVSDYVAEKAYLLRSGIEILAAGVAISGDRYIKLDVNANNYVHIDRYGIDMKGSRVSVNGCDMWARDDIIVMNPNAADSWRRTVAGIESHMNGKHDWVMIRPFYDASINYAGVTGQAQQQTPINNQYTESGSSGKAFGGQADWYNYAITLNLQNNASVYRALTVQVFLANKPFEFDNSSADRRVAAAQQANIICPAVTGTIAATGTLTLNIDSGHVGYNLCGENQKVYYYIHGLNYDGMVINGNTMNATTDTTNGRVPCTTYYYS